MRLVREMALSHTKTYTVEVYRPDVPSQMLTVSDTLEDVDLLPDFALPIADLFPAKRSG